MAAINDLLSRVDDKELRSKLEEELNKLSKQKKFGLVFEEHLPECTPLYDVPIRIGSQVAKKAGIISDIFDVLDINDEVATCVNQVTKETMDIPVGALVCVAQFGEPIYPYLKPIDSVCNAPDNDLWHILIEADNYHALQLLEYLYAGKVDCIYIDPPYNTGTDDWKYNDVFVDSSDKWAHSKWLSFMKKRLLLASKLLSSSGNLIISIGYQEVNRLCLLCEEIFKGKQVVPVTVQTSGGKPSGGFNYLQEYLVFVVSNEFKPNPTSFSGGKKNAPFHGMNLATFNQEQRPNQVYPIYVEKNTRKVIGVGKSLQERKNEGSYLGNYLDYEYDYNEAPDGCVSVWPVSNKGTQCVWRLKPSRFLSDLKKGYIKVLEQKKGNSPNLYSIQYLAEGIIKKIESGDMMPKGRETVNGTLILDMYKSDGSNIPTIWTEKEFYTTKGTEHIQKVFKSKDFQYPKPVALIADVIRACTDKNSLVLDFFAGSGTTLNAVNLLNEQDGFNRRCILITNNELSKKQAKMLKKRGVTPNSNEWESYGVCRSVTWPRTVCTIMGRDIDGNSLEGIYSNDIPMSDGFMTNVAYFKLGFLDKASVRVGRQFCEMLPTLWMKAGCNGACPSITGQNIPEYMVLPENRMAILNDNSSYAQFAEEIKKIAKIKTVYLVTDSDVDYRNMSKELSVECIYQLYRDYLDNFRINSRR